MVWRSSGRVDSIGKPQFINIFHCKLGKDRGGRGHVEVGGGYWPILLTKQFQQVETCFWISNPHPPPPPLPRLLVAHLCCFCSSFIVSSGLISISAGLISLRAGLGKRPFDVFP